MKKKAIGILCLLFSVAVLAFPWESGTHAYIMTRISSSTGAQLANEIYGITAPDLVNFLVTSPYRDYLYNQTHTDVMRLWRQARNGEKFDLELALAYGFVAHNGVWGADSTAHVAALTTTSATGEPEGYIITKAKMLDQYLADTWAALGIGGAEYADLRLTICHEIIEIIVDIQIWNAEHGIGATLVNAAATRTNNIKFLLKRAYAGNLVAYSNQIGEPLNQPMAFSLLADNETAFQQLMLMYGTFFTLPDQATIVGALGGYLSVMAVNYGVTISPEQVAGLLQMVLASGLTGDAMNEIEATITFVKDQLALHLKGADAFQETLAAPQMKLAGGSKLKGIVN